MTPRPPRFEIRAFVLTTGFWYWVLVDLSQNDNIASSASTDHYATEVAALRAGRREIRRTK
jgi:hypothetical protein